MLRQAGASKGPRGAEDLCILWFLQSLLTNRESSMRRSIQPLALLGLVSVLVSAVGAPPVFAGDPDGKQGQEGEGAKSANEGANAALDDQKVDVNFNRTPINAALDFLRTASELAILTPKPGELDGVTVSLKLRGISLRNAIKLVLASDAKLTMRVACGAVIVGHKATVKAIPVAPPKAEESWSAADRKAWKALAARKVTLNLNDTPIADVQGFIGTILGLPGDTLPIEGKIADDLTWTIRVKKHGALEALTLLAAHVGRVPTMKKGKLVLARPGSADEEASAPEAKSGKGKRGPPNAPLGEGSKAGD